MSCLKTCKFFTNGTSNQFQWMLTKYDQCLELKALSKNSNKPENVIKLDKWYQNELPSKIKSRGKDAHLVHEEIVQTIKWKLARGKFRPNLTNMVRMNTPRVVMQETKKAFRKIAKNQDIQSAICSLCTLKGVGPAMASAILSAGAPEIAPYMADECLLSMPDVESLDYTVREYMNLVEFIKGVVERLNGETGGTFWDPHKVEMAVWTHYIANDLKPEILEEMPPPTTGAATTTTTAATNGEAAAAATSETTADTTNGDSNGGSESNGGDSMDSTDVNINKEENGDEKEKNKSEVTPTNGQESAKNGDNHSSEETKTTNGGTEKVNGKATSADIPSSTDSESTNDSTMNNLEAEDTNTNDSIKENVDASSTLTPSAKRPLEEVEKTSSSSSPDADSSDEPAAKKVKEDTPVDQTTAPPAAAAATATPAETAA